MESRGQWLRADAPAGRCSSGRSRPQAGEVLTRLLAILLLVPVGTLAGQTSSPTSRHAPSYKREVPPDLAAQAKIAEDTALARALGRVPRGQVTALVLEREHERLLYSFDIKVPGKAGITEVHVDAVTGRVLRVEHEAD